MVATRFTFITTLLLFCIALSVPSAQAGWAVLREGDLQKFTATFPEMFQQYQKLGLKINSQTGKMSGMERARRDKEVKRILKENGWNFRFWGKLQTIVRGYSLAKYEQVSSNHGANIEKFVRDLSKSRWMSPEKKAELEAFYSQTKINLSKNAEKLRRQVHKKDLSLIVIALPELDRVMQEISRIQWKNHWKNKAVRQR